MVHLADFPEIDAITTSTSHLPDSLPDDVWFRILGYATHITGYNYLRVDPDHWEASQRLLPTVTNTRKQVLLVCKRFHVRVYGQI